MLGVSVSLSVSVSDLKSLQWHVRAFSQMDAQCLHDILQLRQQVFVLEQNCLYADIDGLDVAAHHIWASAPQGFPVTEQNASVWGEGSNIVACARILPPRFEQSRARIGRLLVHPVWRRSSIGRTLLAKAEAEARRCYPGHGVCLSAQLVQLAFYQRAGFESVSTPYDDAGIAHVDMVKD